MGCIFFCAHTLVPFADPCPAQAVQGCWELLGWKSSTLTVTEPHPWDGAEVTTCVRPSA